MNQHYNQNYTKEEVTAILQRIQDCIQGGKYTIAKNENRKENVALIREYNLTSEKQRCILLQIEPEDFCHSLQNTNIEYEYETLYVFVRRLCYSIWMMKKSWLIYIPSLISSTSTQEAGS